MGKKTKTKAKSHKGSVLKSIAGDEKGLKAASETANKPPPMEPNNIESVHGVVNIVPDQRFVASRSAL